MSENAERIKSTSSKNDKIGRSPSKNKESMSISSATKKKSKSRSPDKSETANSSVAKTIKSAKTSKSAKRTTSKSPKRKLTGKDSSKFDNNSQNSLNDAALKSTPELEDLSYQGLTLISSKVFQRATLRKLILCGNNLRSLPSQVADLYNLEYLDISRNPLKVKDVDDSNCLPLEMRLLKNLTYLSVSECNLRYIPTTVWLCISLKILDLSRNKIGLLVPDIGNLQNLVHLNLSQCNLTTLPGEIGFCTDLAEIVLMANQVESLPDSLKDCKNLEQLKMSYRTFSSLLDTYMENLISKGQIKSEHVPVVVFELEKLTNLDLKHTKVNSLPENNLKNLQELFLDYNYFETIGEGTLRSMSQSLKQLTMSNNLLEDLPKEIGILENLEILDLSFNKISSMPVKFELTKLKELYLNDNKLTSLSPSIGSLASLEKLNLYNNEIKEIDEGLFRLTQLTYLDLSYNKITRISPNICNLRNIKVAHSYDKLNKIGLWVIGNPLKIPPKNIWQTTNINKIFDYLGSYIQRTLDHVYYSKIIFIGASYSGKSTLIDCFFNDRHEISLQSTKTTDYRTKVARKFYKRTENKVEWLFLDLAGHATYNPLHSLFFSSIDHDNEPTIFVIVYNHSEYTSTDHKKHIGQWIESVLIHNKPASKNSKIEIQLIGILNGNSLSSNEDTNPKIQMILDNCRQTLSKNVELLQNEKEKISKRLEAEKDSDKAKQLTESMQSINLLISYLTENVHLEEKIVLVDRTFNKEHIKMAMNALENITIRFNKIAPLDLRNELLNHLTKLRTSQIDLNDLASSLNSSAQLNESVKSNPKCSLNTEKIINYAKTIGAIFWLKFNKRLEDKVFLHFNYILNCLKLFIRHDLLSELEYTDTSIFKSIGLYPSENEFLNSVDLFKKYGVLQQKLIKSICFGSSHLKNSRIEASVDLLKDFSVIYKSETQYLEDKCSFFQIVIPTMCMVSYEEEKALKSKNSWDYDLYTDKYEMFFYRLDQLRKYKEEIKEANALKKQKEMWNAKGKIEESECYYEFGAGEAFSNEDGEKMDTLDMNTKIINLNSISHDFEFNNISPKRDDLLSAGKNEEIFKFLDDKSAPNYKFKYKLEYSSPFKFENFIFHKLSALLQEIIYERFDWSDTIVARDLSDSCFKARLFNEDSNSCISIEIKATTLENVNNLKDKILIIIDELFNFYPGLYFNKTVFSSEEN